MKVGIIIITYNLSSEIFLLQMAAIKKFCKDEDYTVEIVDNSSDEKMAEDIRYHASILELNYIKTFAGGMGSDSHAFAANFSYQKFKDKYNYFAYLDHDIIPVSDFSVVEILSGGHVMAGVGQGAQKTYFWPGLLFWNGNAVDLEIIDFSPSHIFGLDTGGNLYKVIEKYGKENCIFFNEAYHQNPFFNSVGGYNHYAMLADNRFMHMINSSNWNDTERHEERINSLINVAKEKTGL